MSEEMVTITREEYDELVDNNLFYECLVGAGVDNWDGYDYAIEQYRELKNE